MGSAVAKESSTRVRFEGFPCGSKLTPGQTGLTVTWDVPLARSTDQYLLEAEIMTTGPDGGGWGFGGDPVATCGGQRLVNSDSETFTAPPDGSVSLRVAWAGQQKEVSTSAACTYQVASAPPALNTCEGAWAVYLKINDDCPEGQDTGPRTPATCGTPDCTHAISTLTDDKVAEMVEGFEVWLVINQQTMSSVYRARQCCHPRCA